MSTMTILREASAKFGLSEDTLLKESFASFLRERRRLLMAERFEMLSRYGVRTSEELKVKIERGDVPEHPTWEDYVKMTNLQDELKNVQNYIADVKG